MNIDSPCINNCQLSIDGSYCISCLRLLSEITEWKSFSDKKKMDIICSLKSRKL
jgi:predicted Fe-S protein YdhL (DUF1289 family)